MQDEFDYRKIVPLAQYIDRIGATCLNFRKYVVREFHNGYPLDRALINIKDGQVFCSREEYSPTEGEASAIALALKTAQFPTAVHFNNYDELRKVLGPEAILFEFWDRSVDQMIMLQQRVEPSDKPKYFQSWSFFSDGKWRAMEPERPLPFWKPRHRTMADRVMVHEGTKAAQFCHTLVNDIRRRDELMAHPWGADLRNYEHWGLIGGALSPHRADYQELRDAAFGKTVYVCDNDRAGQAVLQEFSQHYKRPLAGVRFDQSWKEGFDLADPFPSHFYKDGRYIGKSFREVIVPATFATEMQDQGDGKRPRAVLLKSFKEEWFHSIAPEVFIHKDWPDRMWTLKEFNSFIAPYSHVKDLAALVQRDDSSKANGISYSPHLKPGIYASTTGRYINTFVPSEIEAEEGDPAPWVEFMESLVEHPKDRLELLRWIATLVARPQVKMLYGVLLISEMQGVGKGTLGEKILAPLVGKHNASFPSEGDIVDSQYNYWMPHKRLAVVHEIYAGHSSKAYNRLKSVITDTNIQINKKFMASYNMENWCHVFACSNSMRAIQISADDRRWFVPRVTEVKKSHEYWATFNKWLFEKGGLGIIRWWCDDFLTKNKAVIQGDAAPPSRAKDELIEDSYSPGQALVARTLDEISLAIDGGDPALLQKLKERGYLKDDGVFVMDTHLVNFIRDKIHEGRFSDKLEKPATVRKVAKAKGWFVGEHRSNVKAWDAPSAKMITNTDKLAKALPASLCSEKMPEKDRRYPVDLSLLSRI